MSSSIPSLFTLRHSFARIVAMESTLRSSATARQVPQADAGQRG